jgi:hypothetical protein
VIPKDAEGFYITIFDKTWALTNSEEAPYARIQQATRAATEAVKAVYGAKELLEGAERE